MLYYCGFDTFLQFRQKSGKNNVFLQPLSDLVLDRQDKVINAFIGWCSLFLQTGKGQVLYLGYSKAKVSPSGKPEPEKRNDMVVCSEVPKYIVNIECASQATFLLTLDLDLYKWSGFNFAKTFPTHISLDPNASSSINSSNNNDDPTQNSTPTAKSDADNNNSSVQKKEDSCTAATTASSAPAINNSTDSENHPSSSSEPLKAEQLSIGVEFSCLLTDHGQAYLFDVATETLGALLAEESIVAVSAGQEHVLLLAEDGTVLSFGHGSRGQLGHGTLDNVLEKAIHIEALQGLKCKAIAAGGWYSLVLSEAGDVYVFGWNESGQLGLSRTSTPAVQAVPTLLEISEDDAFSSVSAGSRHSMALSENGLLFGWGWNKWGQLGLDPSTVALVDTPTVIPVDEKVATVCCKFWASLIETERESGEK